MLLPNQFGVVDAVDVFNALVCLHGLICTKFAWVEQEPFLVWEAAPQILRCNCSGFADLRRS